MGLQQIILEMSKALLINLMIINSNLQENLEAEDIEYIRTIANCLKQKSIKQESSDSLIVSHSESDSLNMNLIVPEKKKKKKKQKTPQKYVSPYKQSSLSMRRILKSKGRNQTKITPFSNAVIQNSVQSETPKAASRTPRNLPSVSRYKHIPPLLDRLERDQMSKMKAQARIMYDNKIKDKEELTPRLQSQRWADFLLRERRFEQEKRNKLMQARQRMISRQRQQMNVVTPRKGPRPNIDDHIKSVKRKKTKLQEQLRDLSLNYYTWQTHSSPLITKRQKSPLSAKSRQALGEHRLHLQSKSQVQFLVKK